MLIRILYIAGVGLFAVFAPTVLAAKGQRFFLIFALAAGLLATLVAAPSAFLSLGLVLDQPRQALGGLLAALLGFGLPVYGSYGATQILAALDSSARAQNLVSVVVAALLIPVALPLAFALNLFFAG